MDFTAGLAYAHTSTVPASMARVYIKEPPMGKSCYWSRYTVQTRKFYLFMSSASDAQSEGYQTYLPLETAPFGLAIPSVKT